MPPSAQQAFEPPAVAAIADYAAAKHAGRRQSVRAPLQLSEPSTRLPAAPETPALAPTPAVSSQLLLLNQVQALTLQSVHCSGVHMTGSSGASYM